MVVLLLLLLLRSSWMRMIWPPWLLKTTCEVHTRLGGLGSCGRAACGMERFVANSGVVAS